VALVRTPGWIDVILSARNYKTDRVQVLRPALG
jgi:hypothetical protein